MATLLDLSHINLNLQQNVQPANLVSQPVQDYNALDKAGLKASQEFLQSFAKARAVTIDIQDDANASTNALDFERDISSKLDEASNLQGTKAQEAFDALPEKIAQAREVYTDKNLNARQKFLFSKKTKDMENGFLIRANSIQAQKAMQDKLKAMSQELKNKINDVALTWNTPVFEQNLQTLKDLVAEQQNIIGYNNKDDIENAQREATSKLFSTVISGDIQNKRYGVARRALTEHADDLDGIDRIRLMNALTASMTSDAEEKQRQAHSDAMELYRSLKQSARDYMDNGQFDLGKKANDQANAIGVRLGLPPLVLGANDVVAQKKYNGWLVSKMNETKKNKGYSDLEKQQRFTELKQNEDLIKNATDLISVEFKGKEPKTKEEKDAFALKLNKKIDELAYGQVEQESKMAYESADFNSKAVTQFFDITQSLKMDYDNSGAINTEDFIQRVCAQSEDARKLVASLSKEQYADFKDLVHPMAGGREVGNDVGYNNIMKTQDLTLQFKDLKAVKEYAITNHFSRQQANDLKMSYLKVRTTKNTKTLEQVEKADKNIYAQKMFGNDYKDLEPEEQILVSKAVSARNTAVIQYADEHNLNLEKMSDWMTANIMTDQRYDFTKVNVNDQQVAFEQAQNVQTVSNEASQEMKDFADSYLPADEKNNVQSRYDLFIELEPFNFTTGYGKTSKEHTILVRQPIVSLVDSNSGIVGRFSPHRDLDIANIQEMDKDSMDKYNKPIQSEADIVEFLAKYERDNGKKWQIKYTSPNYHRNRYLSKFNVSE